MGFLRNWFNQIPKIPIKGTSHGTHHPHRIDELYPWLCNRHPSFKANSKQIDLLSKPIDFHRRFIHHINTAQRSIYISTLYIGEEQNELVGLLQRRLRENQQLTVTILADFNRFTRQAHPPHSPASLISPLVRLFGNRIYCFDDTVLLSGANLNTSYFTNRQDRYMQITDNFQLSNYLRAFVELMTRFSYKLCDSDDVRWENDAPASAFSDKAREEMEHFTRRQCRMSNEQVDQPQYDTTIYPLIQSGLWGVREEEDSVHYLLDAINSIPGAILHMTSGYFSLGGGYKRRVMESRVPTWIIAASPDANGFLGSRGVSGRIPEAYTHLMSKFYTSSIKHHRHNSLQLKEWRRNGWTYHCKGLWIRNEKSADDAMATLIGSSNLSGRSSNLDLELSFLLMTSSGELKKRLQGEVEELNSCSTEVSEKTFKQPQRKVSLFTRFLLWMGVEGML
ncbi:hypothetical protein E3P78_03003 [Wallemia ichthyophaga]|uniref:CDP-diacylglycerol--glycerol-3-phosphate 3-phosphatidyltransferase n=1 Tax=Wallemia ichthyophaga TaxID=245174 RepID=A0A4T0EXF2_WALIC|nr:hypothetical protein E3P98_03055 [Wallemia ichthyophaga]TIB36030.1 hypothetical protein E3P86_02576 [Wallemia ichthyophaga]TIB60846.1 hypothetical protein E3P78_03003 [Wallemia ichthyophaga]